ncbi:MAG: GIN domain-containing protein [Bacteroidota bacterium]
MNRLLWLLVVAVLTPACNYIDALTEEGETIREEYEMEDFEKIVLDTSVRLVLTNDSLPYVVAEGPDFVLSRLKVDFQENEMHVDADGMFGFRQEQMPELTVSAGALKQVRSNFASEITNEDTLEIDRLRIVISGRGAFTECDLTVKARYLDLSAYGSNVGNHRLSGKASTLKIYSEGLTSMDALDLVSDKVVYHQRSVNPGYVNAVSELNVEMKSSGNVYYKGTPKTDVEFVEPSYKVKLGNVIEYTP